MVFDGLLSSWEQHSEYQRAKHSKAEQAVSEAYARCQVGSAPADWSEQCLIEQVRAYAEAYDTNEDLRAQRDMAFWALVMAFVSAGGLLLSAIGLMGLFMSLHQTRRAISDTRELGEAEIRAYLYFKVEKVAIERKENADGSNVTVKFIGRVHNCGSTPSYVFQVLYDIVATKPGQVGSTKADGSQLHQSPKVMAYLPPNDSRPEELTRTFTVDFDAFPDGKPLYRLTYIIKYLDVFYKDVLTPPVSGTIYERPKGSGTYIWGADVLTDILDPE